MVTAIFESAPKTWNNADELVTPPLTTVILSSWKGDVIVVVVCEKPLKKAFGVAGESEPERSDQVAEPLWLLTLFPAESCAVAVTVNEVPAVTGCAEMLNPILVNAPNTLKAALCPVTLPPTAEAEIRSSWNATDIVALVCETPLTKSLGAAGDNVPDRSDQAKEPLKPVTVAPVTASCIVALTLTGVPPVTGVGTRTSIAAACT